MSDLTLGLAATERVAVAGPRHAAHTVVFLHGLGCERGQFARQLEGLDAGHRLLSLDLPGHGESPPLPSGAHTVASMSRAVGRELADRGHRAVVLVGHSAGGLVALELAVARPELVRGIVLLDTNIVLSDKDRRTNRDRATESEKGEWRRYFLSSMLAAWGDDHGADDTARAAVFAALAHTPEHVVRPFWHDILAFDSRQLWRRCQAPCRYVRSRRSTDLAALRSLNPLISTVDLRPHCSGHWPHVQCAGAVNEALRGFLAQLAAHER
jgi:pimeloyl-ACP methyl ester carboxylesterase